MKIVFSTKNVHRASFLDTCRYAFDYGFQGFEIYDAIKERNAHHDSILRRDRIADAKRKLVNRNLEVSALRVPDSIDDANITADLVVKYVDMAFASGISNVIIRIDNQVSYEVLDEKLTAAIKKAEKTETVALLNNFISAMDEDFNTPVAIAEMLKINKIVAGLKEDEASKLIAKELLYVMKQMEFVLGLKFENLVPVQDKANNEEVLANIIADVRTKLRSEKNYALADYIRDELTKNGIVVNDKKI